jgi:hypothetical protein
MTISNELWVKYIITNTKLYAMITMLILAITSSNYVGLVMYISLYQLASLFRLFIYTIIFPQSESNTYSIFGTYDFTDIATYISSDNTIRTIVSPVYMLAFTLAFVSHTIYTNSSAPSSQIIFTIASIISIVMYITTLSILDIKYKLLPYIEAVGGWFIGFVFNYIIEKKYKNALFFKPINVKNNKRVIRRCVKLA